MSCAPGIVERIAAALVAPVRPQPLAAACHQLVELGGVVDEQHDAVPQARRAVVDPRPRSPAAPGCRVPTGTSTSASQLTISSDARTGDLVELAGLGHPDPDLEPAVRGRARRGRTARLSSSSFAMTTPSTVSAGSSSSALTIGPRALDRHRHAAVAEIGARRAERVLERLDGQQLALLPRAAPPTARRARTAARARTSGSARSTSRHSRPDPGARLHHDERIGIAELVPPPVERAGDARAEQRTDLGARDEVAAGAPGAVTGREEAGLRVVERGLDEGAERDRPGPVDPFREPGSSARGLPAGGELADAGEDLRVDADDEHDRGADADRGVERERDLQRRRVDVVRAPGGTTSPGRPACNRRTRPPT